MRKGGEMYAKAVGKIALRKRALELAVTAFTARAPGYPEDEHSKQIQKLADEFFEYMTKDRPTAADVDALTKLSS